MRIRYLFSSSQRAWGAMFRHSLKDEILVFLYPVSTAHTFHTFFCPPLHMAALDGAGRVLFDQVVPPNRFVKLPACRIVLEYDPETDYSSYLVEILTVAETITIPQSAAWHPDYSLDSLLFGLFAAALADLRRVRNASPDGVVSETLRQRFSPWERGRFAASAGFVLEFPDLYQLPEEALELSRELILAESPYLDELFAASVGDMPWKQVFLGICLRCGGIARWKQALLPPPNTPPEAAWRYRRPENCVPLCRACTMTTGFRKDPILRTNLAWGLWGARFEALWRWHRNLSWGNLPEWDKLAFPLWPPRYGGETWETGSGALEHATPRPPAGVSRSAWHDRVFWQALSGKEIRKRPLTDAHLRALVIPELESEVLDGAHA